MCKVNNQDNNQKARQPPNNTRDPQVIWDIPVQGPTRNRVLVRVPDLVSITEIRNILAAAERFDNLSASTIDYDDWSILSADTVTTVNTDTSNESDQTQV